MRCDEVIRELAVPTDDRDRSVLDAHLAACPSCRSWNHRAAMLDRLWDATRPAEPSAEAWDSVWSKISQGLQSPAASRDLTPASAIASHPGASPRLFSHSGPAPMQPDGRPRTRRFVAIAMMVGLAQAAAILIAVGMALQAPPVPPTPQNHRLAQNPNPTAPHGPSVIRVSQPLIVEADIEIEEGHMIMISLEGPSPKLVDRTPPEVSFGGIVNKTAGNMEMFNAAESFASTVVASQ